MKPLEEEIQEILSLAQTPLPIPPHQEYFSNQEFSDIKEELKRNDNEPEIGHFIRAIEDKHFIPYIHKKLVTYLLENKKLFPPAGLNEYPKIKVHPKAKYESQGQVNIFLRNDNPIHGVQLAGWGLEQNRIDEGHKIVYSHEQNEKIIANIQTKSIWDVDEIRPIYDDNTGLYF